MSSRTDSTRSLLEHLCRTSPLNLPDNTREAFEPGIAECQDSDPLGGVVESLRSRTIAACQAQLVKVGRQPNEDGWILPNPNGQEAKDQILRDTLTEDTCLSFDEWKDAGYWVRKGARSVFKDALGVPQFTIEQVLERQNGSQSGSVF